MFKIDCEPGDVIDLPLLKPESLVSWLCFLRSKGILRSL